MAQNIHELAARLGATVVGQVPDTGGGAFGVARLAVAVAALRADAPRVESAPVLMTEVTARRLAVLAGRASAGGVQVTPMQVAARLLEEAVARLPEG